MPILTLSEEHEYALDGEKIPGVSQIIRDAGLSDVTWTNEDALKRGSHVHLATEFDDEGDLNEAELDPRLLGYLKGWRKFRVEFKVKIQKIEQKVYHELYRYAGKLDRILEIEGHLYVIDLKTGAAAAWHPIQTALYAMTQPNQGARLSRAAVYLMPNGDYRFVKHEDREDFNVAKAAITLAGWKARNL